MKLTPPAQQGVHLCEAVDFCFFRNGELWFLQFLNVLATARVDVPTVHENSLSFRVILNSFMLVLLIHETQKSRSAMEDRRETGSLSAILNPVQPGPDLPPVCRGPAPSCRSTTHVWTPSVPCLCVRAFFEHVLVGFCSIEHVHAAPQHAALERNVPRSIYRRGHVRLPPVVLSSFGSSLFFASVPEAARFIVGGCTYAVEAARQGKPAEVTVELLHHFGASAQWFVPTVTRPNWRLISLSSSWKSP